MPHLRELRIFLTPVSLQVDKIVNFNNFSSRLKTSEHSSPHCFGLWSLAARINHSCTSNGRRGFIGDFLVARATRDIPKDKEITWPYYKLTRDIDDVQKELAEGGFQCTCAICIDVTSTSVRLLTKRKNLIQTLKITLDALRVNTKRAEQLLSECEKPTQSRQPRPHEKNDVAISRGRGICAKNGLSRAGRTSGNIFESTCSRKSSRPLHGKTNRWTSKATIKQSLELREGIQNKGVLFRIPVQTPRLKIVF